MLRRSGWLSYTNVTATLALVFALGAGGAVAGSLITGKQVKRGTLTGKHLKRGSISTREVRDGGLTAKDIGGLESANVRVVVEPGRAQPCATGMVGVGEPPPDPQQYPPCNSFGPPQATTAMCGQGEVAVGGGFAARPDSEPYSSSFFVEDGVSRGWTVSHHYEYPSGPGQSTTTVYFPTAYVLCAPALSS